MTRPVNLARLRNDLRDAERDWQGYAMFDADPTVRNPWAALRDEAAERIAALRAEIDAAMAARREVAA